MTRLWNSRAAAEPLVAWGVLAAATIAALVISVNGGAVIPYWADEWMYAPIIMGEEPVTPRWLVAFHNEHRVPLAKLIWAAAERWSGFDGRWGSVLNTLMLAAAAGLLLRGIRDLRGRTTWTDAVVPLLLLHGGNAENITWPFQVAFCLLVLVLAWIICRIIALGRRPPDEADPGLAAAVFLLPFCGASTFPFVLLLAPWTIWISRRDPRPNRRRLSIGLAAGALLLVPFYFGYTSDWAPPSPGLVKDLIMAVIAVTSSLGIAGSAYWPQSGCFAVAIVAIATMLLVRQRKTPVAAGLLLVLSSLVGLALVIGHYRSGTYYYTGMPNRYVTLFCLVPVLAYVSLHFLERPVGTRICQVTLLLLAGAFYIRNAKTAQELVATRRAASDAFLRDVRAGLPTSLLARRHSAYWAPVFQKTMEKGLECLARNRGAFYRTAPAPLPWTEGARLTLPDGRLAADLEAGAVVPLGPSTRRIRVDAGLLTPPAAGVWCTVRLLRDGAEPRLLGRLNLGQQTDLVAGADYEVDGGAGMRLDLTPSGSVARPWAIVETR